MTEAQRLRESAAMVQRLAEQQTVAALREHLLQTARGWRRMAAKAEAAETRSVADQQGALNASLSPRAA